MKNETETCECGMNKEEHYSPWKIEGACKKFKPLAYDYKNSNYNRMEDTQTPEYKTYPYRDGKKDGVELNRAVVTDKTSGDSVPDSLAPLGSFCLSDRIRETIDGYSNKRKFSFLEEDVKEFVRRLKEDIYKNYGSAVWLNMDRIIDALAGEKLTK